MTKILYVGNKLSSFGNTPGTIETLGKLLSEEGIKVFYAGERLNKYARLFDMLYKTFKYRNKADFILIDTYSTSAFWFSFYVGYLSKLLKLKYIPILHGGNLPERINNSRFASRILFNNSYENVAVSNYLDLSFKKEGYSSIIIPNTIQLDDYKFKERKIFKPNILWVRSFHKDYNPNMAINVLSNLMIDYPQANLCMVGPVKDESLEEFKQYAIDKNVTDNITITGRLSKKDWHTLSKKFDFFINTTNFDNTPVSVMEAMALGLPVISTNVGGLPFLLEDGVDALLVNKNDSLEMTNMIKKLIFQPDLAQNICEKAKLKVSKLDWQVVKLKWIKLLRYENL